MAEVILLCGKIAVGKTTYAAYLQRNRNAVVLSCDELMLSLFDSCLGDKHDATVKRCSLYLSGIADQVVAAGVDVVLDFGSWTAAERDAVRTFFAEHNIPVRLYYLFCEESVRLERLRLRNIALRNADGRVYIIEEDLRRRLDAKFELPSENETDKLIDTTHLTV
ncbi:MAG: ATP-binding protein [Clostridiales bacterium]|nr:ATP-binding protein [Clostridiales bacterium]